MPVNETSVFAETADFQEVGTNEPVLGGLSPEGPINRIARVLGSRTLWLRAQIALLVVKGWWFKFVTPLTSSYTVVKDDAGSFYSIGGTASGIVITLPNGSNPSLIFSNGQTITFKNNNPNSITIQRHPSCTDIFDNGLRAFSLKPGDTVTLAYDESLIWYIVFRTRTKDNVGMVSAFAGSSPPQGYLICNGAAISRTTYAYLFSIIGVSYGAGDGSTTFNIPDLRGEFIRGLDLGRGVDTGRTLGSAQSENLKEHNHAISTSLVAIPEITGTNFINPDGIGSYGDINTQNSGGSETRPRNIAMNYIIYHGVV